MIVVIKLDTAILMELITFEKNEVIPFQISTKNCLIFVQVSSHVVPNQPNTVSAIPLNAIVQDSNLDFIPSQIAVILFLNSSLVFHKFANAAIRTPITATTATTGAEIPLIAALTAVNALLAFAIAPGILPNVVIILPTLDVSLPSTISTGPIAAAIAAHLTICSFCSGVNSCNFCVKF